MNVRGERKSGSSSLFLWILMVFLGFLVQGTVSPPIAYASHTDSGVRAEFEPDKPCVHCHKQIILSGNPDGSSREITINPAITSTSRSTHSKRNNWSSSTASMLGSKCGTACSGADQTAIFSYRDSYYCIACSPPYYGPTGGGEPQATPQDITATISYSTGYSSSNGQACYGTSSTSMTTCVSETTSGTSHSVGLTGLSPSTTYYYKVVFTDSTGRSFDTSWNGAQSFTTLPPQGPTPPVLDATNPGTGTSLNLTWTAGSDPDGIDHYEIYRDSGPANSLPGDSIATTTAISYVDTGLTKDQEYCYMVRIIDKNNVPGDFSNEDCATTKEITVKLVQEVIPVAKWRFDSGATPVPDDSGMGNPLTVCKYVDATTPCATPDSGFWTTDTPSGTGYAGYFIKSPNRHYATTGPNPKGFEEFGMASFEIGAWIKRGTTSGFYPIVMKGDSAQTNQPGWGLRVNGRDHLLFHLRDGVTSLDHEGSIVIPPDQWTHVRAVVDRGNNTVQLYVNGQPDEVPFDISSVAGATSDPGQAVFVGTGYHSAQSPPYTGTLDYRLDQVEVNLLYSTVGLWPFDEGIGSLAGDDSGLGNHLGLTADTIWCSPGPNGSGFALCPSGANFAMIQDAVQKELDMGGLSFEISAWIRINVQGFNPIVNKQNGAELTEGGYHFRVNNDNQLLFHLRDGVNSLDLKGTLNKIPLNAWTHVRVAVDRTAKTVQLYVNGQPDGVTGIIPDGFGSISNNEDFLAGASYNAGYRPAAGLGISQLQVKRIPAIPTNLLNLTTTGYWNFEDECPGGIAADLSGYGNELTLVGPPDVTTPADCVGKDLYGPAKRADADQHGLDLGMSSFEISAWIRFNAPDFHPIVNKQDGAQPTEGGLQFRVNKQNKLVFGLRDGSTSPYEWTGTAAIPTGQWTHVRVVVDRVNHTGQLYVNGDPDGAQQTLPTTLGSLDNPQDFRVGAGETSDNYTVGTDYLTIDNLTVRKALIPTGQWEMNEGLGSSLHDSSSWGNDLTACKYVDATTPCAAPDSGFWSSDTPDGTGYAGYFIKSPNIHYAKRADADLRGLELGTASFEVSAWIKRGTTSGMYVVAGKGDGNHSDLPAWGLRVNSRNNLVFHLRDGVDTTADHFVDYIGAFTVPDAWTHVRVVVDRRNKTVQLYVNGQPDGLPGTIPDAMGDVSSNGQDLVVGTGYNTAQSPPYTGTLDFRLDQVELKRLE